MKINFINHSIAQQHRVFTALILSGILSISSGMTLIKSATASPVKSILSLQTENTKSQNLPISVKNAIFRDLSRRRGILISNLDVIEYQEKTWNNGCLGLAKPGELCTQALVPGWQVTVGDGKQSWIYHTNRNGRIFRVSGQNIPNNNLAKLPANIRNSVLKHAADFLKLPISQLTIIQSEKRDWKNGCLELVESGRVCSQIIVPGWKVFVGTKEKVLVYHTNAQGSVIRLNQTESDIKDKQLPVNVRNNILKAAAEYSNLSVSELRIVEVGEITVDGCLSLPKPGESCTKIAQPAWKVTVQARKQKLVYHAKKDGSQVRLNLFASNLQLPQNIVDIVLYQASQQSRLPISRLKIITSERKQWSDSCLGIPNSQTICAQVIVPGWQVKVSDGNKNWVYRIGESVTVSYDKNASEISVPIPTSELPPPLESGVVFRQVTSGGFFARNYQTILLDDGRLIRTRIGDANDSERSIYRISQQQLQNFQELLEQQENAFQNVNYPPTFGAADYLTYTITSSNGTVQFNDISQNNLPESLKVVVKAWNDLNSNNIR
ncbi:hypothetical protein [Calothrix sp. UHCC 0171]|uniref:hypothetical protein n=1 Tax=Calothrix sp. UHCC 0171 TaxID=3110245 RepID=UPI002B1F996A|nr:hypothetical protein [Calothrix sp. UHCC 0171]MEA5569895.1 hypothetical protein [Calothrix sp. UHCC 0171]